MQRKSPRVVRLSGFGEIDSFGLASTLMGAGALAGLLLFLAGAFAALLLIGHFAQFFFAHFPVAIGVNFVEVFDESFKPGFGRFIGGNGAIAIGISFLQLPAAFAFFIFEFLMPAEFFSAQLSVAVDVNLVEVFDQRSFDFVFREAAVLVGVEPGEDFSGRGRVVLALAWAAFRFGLADQGEEGGSENEEEE